MAELADAQDSGSCARKGVGVQVPPRARSIAGRRSRTAHDDRFVLGQLALGRTDRRIADELFISKKTVSVHVSNILRELDATNRIDAAEIGQRAGPN